MNRIYSFCCLISIYLISFVAGDPTKRFSWDLIPCYTCSNSSQCDVVPSATTPCTSCVTVYNECKRLHQQQKKPKKKIANNNFILGNNIQLQIRCWGVAVTKMWVHNAIQIESVRNALIQDVIEAIRIINVSNVNQKMTSIASIKHTHCIRHSVSWTLTFPMNIFAMLNGWEAPHEQIFSVFVFIVEEIQLNDLFRMKPAVIMNVAVFQN